MDYTIPISPEVLALVAKILVGTQAIKKLLESKLFQFILAKISGGAEVGAILAIVISAAVGICFGIQQYGQDGLTISEIIDIFSAIFGANGAFALGKSLLGKPAK